VVVILIILLLLSFDVHNLDAI